MILGLAVKGLKKKICLSCNWPVLVTFRLIMPSLGVTVRVWDKLVSLGVALLYFSVGWQLGA